MTTKLTNIIAYILEKYPYKDELCNARVTKMIYLSDWKFSLLYEKQISDISWFFDNYGPFVHDVERDVSSNADVFSEKIEFNMYGGYKKIFSLKKEFPVNLTHEEQSVIVNIIDICKKLYFDNFIKLVYSTYPIMTSERYSQLNLIEKAKEYKEKKNIMTSFLSTL